jgi:hypothetical protein
MSNFKDYYDALDRLKANKPLVVPKNSSINNDTVAVEAGRGRGSIKSGRAQFSVLIEMIKLASGTQPPSEDEKLKEQISKVKGQKNELRKKYEASLNRELMLAMRLQELETVISSDNVVAGQFSGKE